MKTPFKQIISRVICLCLLTGATALQAADGIWTTDGTGNWSDIANWNSGSGPIADGSGSTAWFTNTITAARTVTLDTTRTIGNLVFAGSAALNWTLTENATLTLGAGSGTPTITVNSNTATIAATSVGNLAGTQGLLKNGVGTLVLSSNNTYTGGTTIGGGLLAIGNAINPGQVGTGSVTITNGAILQLSSGNGGDPGLSGAGSFTNALVIPAVQTGTLWNHWRGSLSGNLTGSGTLNLRVNGTRGDLSGNWSAFAGQINVTARNGGDDFRQANGNGYTSGKLNLASGVNMYYTPNPPNNTVGINIPIGELSGTAGSTIRCGTALGRYVNWQIGALNTSSTFGGNFATDGANGYSRIYKVGTGSLTLTNNNTFYSPLPAAVAVNAGKLVLATGGSISNSAMTVAASATNGILVVSTGSQAAETNLILSASSALEFNYGAITPSTSVAPLQVLGTLSATNTVVLNVVGGVWAPGTYPLVKYAGTLGGNGFGAFSLGTLPLRVAATLNNNTGTSTIELAVSAVNEPLKWTVGNLNWDIAISSNWKDAASTTTTYQEQVGLGDQVVFDDTASGTSPITVTLNTNVTPVSVTFSNNTKNYVLAGVSNIMGTTALTKTGGGTLTIQNTNSFNGGLYVNGGILNFSSLANLGTGGINFQGGTLQFASGNVEDISTRTVWFGPGGGTIDDGGNALTFAKPVGNSGPGGLTKTGAGTLTLTGTNKYFGNTVVANGTLALGANTYISNSAAIIVNSGKVLDAVTSGVNLNLATGQILAGAGTVNGNVSVPSGTTVSPGTNGVVGTLTLGNDLTFSGGNCAYDVSTTAHDLIVVNGNLTLNSGTILTISAGTLTNGVYKIIQYSGSLLSGAGSAGNLVISGFLQAGKIATLSDATAGEIDLVVVSQGGTVKVWQGDGGNNYWDVETTSDWTNSAGVTAMFVQGDKTIFNDTSANTSVNLQAAVQPGSVTVNGTQSYTFSTTTTGRISGSGSVTNNSSGTLTIATANNNTGQTVINAGIVQVGAGVGGDIGSGNVLNNTALVFNQGDGNVHTVEQISGQGLVTQQGSATVAYDQNNTYSGGTLISAGVLQVGAGAGAAGSLGTGPVTNNATLLVNRSGSYALNNTISGSGAVSFAGSGTVTLSGVNTYLDNTRITNGIVKLSTSEEIPDANNVPGSTGWLILDGGPVAGTFDLNGFNETINSLSGLAGTVNGVITNSGASTATTNILTVLENAATTYNGTIVDNPTGAKTTLTVEGNSALRLNGNNTYTGGTFVGDTAELIYATGATIGGGGQITLSNGTTFYLQNVGGNSAFTGNNIFIPPTSSATIGSSSQGNGYGGNVIGDSTATNVITANVSFGSGNVKQFQSFTGTVVVATGGGLRFSSTGLTVNGGDNATFELHGGVNTRNGTATGAGISIGALTGDSSGALNGAGNADGNGVYLIGLKNLSTVFSGSIHGSTANRITSIVKTGIGSLTLDGTLDYTGSTTINNGSLIIGSINNGGTSLDSSPTITIVSNAVLDVSARSDSTLNLGNSVAQTLSGLGTINGSVNASASIASTIIPGGAGTEGTLVITNGLTLNNGTTNRFDFNTANTVGGGINDLITVGKDLTLSGTVYVSPNFPQGGIAFGVPYTLITYAGTLTGDTNNLALDTANNPHLQAVFSTSTPGAITVTFLGTSNLVWRGDSTNSWQVGVVTNWFDGASSNSFAQLDPVTFNDSASNFTAVLAGTVTPAAITVNATSNYVFTGSGLISGVTGITKTNTGSLTISNTGANTFTGLVLIKGGTLIAGSTTALGATNGSTVITNTGALDVNGRALGAEPVTVSGNGSGSGAILNSGAAQQTALQFVALAGDTTFGGTSRWDIRTNALGAALQGNGYKLTKVSANDIYLVNVGNASLGNVEIQQGRIGVQDNTLLGSGTLTLFAGAGLDFWNNGVTNTKAVTLTNATISSSSGTNVYGGTINLNGTGTFTATTPLQLNGALSGPGGLLANGAGLLTLNNAETYTGDTTISNGVLALTATASLASTNLDVAAAGAVLDVSAQPSGLLTLASGKTLKGNGTVRGSVTEAAGSSITPGESIGTITVTNAVNLAGNTVMEINKANAQTSDRIVCASVNYGGTLTLNNVGPALAVNDFFQLFSVTGTRTGAFATVAGSPGPGLAWYTNNLTIDGTIAVVAAPSGPATLTNSVSGNQLTLSWPAGWWLESQTNGVSQGLGNNWVTNTSATSPLTITLDPTKGSVFYRLIQQ